MRTLLRRLTSGGMLIAIAGLLGLLTFAAALQYLQGREGEAGAASRAPLTTAVVVARQEIPAGTLITEAMVIKSDAPTGVVVGGSFSKLEDVLGHVTRYPLQINEQVVTSKLVAAASPAGTTGLAYSIPPKMRAVGVPISQVSAAGGLIVPGDRVDILVTTQSERLLAPTDARPPQTGPVTLTLLQDVLVLAIAQTVTPPVEVDRDPATLRQENAAPQPAAGTATVAVTPADAQLLFMAQDAGKLGLSLRPFGAQAVESLSPRFKIEAVLNPPSSTASNR